jgi:transcriptional regulator with XRE-family HTH domain
MDEVKQKYLVRKIRKKRRTNLMLILRGKKITQKKLAEMADMEVYQISKIATGMQKDLLMSTAKRICNALNVTLDEAFGD